MAYPETAKIFLPDFNLSKVFKIPSDENVRVKYRVSLNDMTCDCPEFVAKKSHYEKNDFRRTCKHIRSAIVQSEIMADSWLRKLIGDRFEHEHYYVPEGKDCAFGYSTGNPWIQYYGKDYATKKGSKVYYGRFSYSVTEKRWSSNQEPMNAVEVVAMIEEYFAVTEAQRNWKPRSKELSLTLGLLESIKKGER
jgi:hypothetical protein